MLEHSRAGTMKYVVPPLLEVLDIVNMSVHGDDPFFALRDTPAWHFVADFSLDARRLLKAALGAPASDNVIVRTPPSQFCEIM